MPSLPVSLWHLSCSRLSTEFSKSTAEVRRREESRDAAQGGARPKPSCTVCVFVVVGGGVPRELGLRAWGHSSPPWHGPSAFSAPGPVLRAGAKGEKDRRRSPYRASIPSPGHAVPGCVQMPPSCLSRCPGCSRGSSPLPLLCPSWRTHQLAGGVRMD